MPLSVGLEFEFVATALVGGGPLPGHDDPARQLESIAGPLRKEGFAVDIHPDPNPSDLNYERWNVMFDKSIQLGASRITRLSPMPRFGFQLITPAFKKVTDSDWATTIEGAINVVGKAITIETNESTGLHVHVGQHKEFTVPEIKKILFLVCKYESKCRLSFVIVTKKKLICFHPPTVAIDAHYHKEHRITGNEFTASNIWNSQLKQFDVHSDVYNHIRQVKTVDGLLNLANPPKHPAGDESRRYYHVSHLSFHSFYFPTIR